jgi:hypothetical protein
MIVYVESNFILELAYLQEEHEICERILLLAEQQSVSLFLPGFCIGEPNGAWVGRYRRRARIHDDLTRELKELARSQPYTTSRDQFQEITRVLAISGGEEKQRLDATVLRVLDTSNVIPLDHAVLEAAIELGESLDCRRLRRVDRRRDCVSLLQQITGKLSRVSEIRRLMEIV